ncbi:MAG TPA: isochorismatase family protein [Hyphomicrobiales bacterium]|nr:isochorismatase family protein [Hyphomicrobiales bacterium]
MTLHVDPSDTALVLIDIQNGTLAFPLSPYGREDLIGRSAELCRAFMEAGAMIVKVRIAFSPDGGDRLSQAVDMPMMLPEGGFPDGWSDIAPEIDKFPAALTITKRQWSAFFGTELDLQFRRRGIRTVVLAGIATNFGVESTARDGWQLGYAMVIAEDACTSLGADMHEFAIGKTLPRVSRILATSDIANAFSQAT